MTSEREAFEKWWLTLPEGTQQRMVKGISWAAWQAARQDWQPMDSVPTETGVEVLAVIRGSHSGKMHRIVLKRVNAPDHEWEFDDDELSNAWDVIAWAPLLPLPPAPQDRG